MLRLIRVFNGCMKELGSLAPFRVHSEDWLDCMYMQAFWTPRPVLWIRPRMYVGRSIMYENAAFYLPEEYSFCIKVPLKFDKLFSKSFINRAASSEFGTYRLCEQRRFRRACASAQSRQNLRYSLIQAVSQEEPSDRKPDPWPLWMAGHAQLRFVMTECSKTQIRLTRPNKWINLSLYHIKSLSHLPFNKV